MRACGANVSLRDVTIAQMGNGTTECKWRHALEVHGGFWEFWRKLVELSSASEEDSWLSLAHGGFATGAHEIGGRWKSQNRKNVYLSPCVEEPLNSKVIKSFVPEVRSRKCFSCFEIPMFYVYLYEHYISISHIHIGLCNIFKVKEPNLRGGEKTNLLPI